VLLKIGKWLEKNREAIYKTRPDPFQISFSWGSVTVTRDKMNLIVMKNPEGGVIKLPGLNGDIKNIYVLGDTTVCNVSQTPTGLAIQFPASLDINREFKVIVLEFADGFSVRPANIFSVGRSGAVLDHQNSFKYFSNSGIDYSTRYTSTIKEEWTLESSRDIELKPELFYSEEEKGKVLDANFNGVIQVVSLTDGKEIFLKKRPLKFGPMYLQGPFWSGIQGAHDTLTKVDVNKPWFESKPWQLQSGWKNGGLYTLPANKENAYYVLQEIESEGTQSALVKITSGDALTVWINGKQKFTQLNLLNSDTVSHFVLLDLTPGKNQLVVKLFNNFHKQIHFALDFSSPQVIYKKELRGIKVKKGELYGISWRLNSPNTPHQDMGIPNARLVLTRE
jgi:alpha-L-fucosidase